MSKQSLIREAEASHCLSPQKVRSTTSCTNYGNGASKKCKQILPTHAIYGKTLVRLFGIKRRLDTQWNSWPYLTLTKMLTTQIDSEIMAKCSRALQEFNQSPQGKLIALIGRSALQGCAWSDRLNEICVRVAEQTHTPFDEDEVGVLTELYGRITTLWAKTSYRQPTPSARCIR